MEVEEQDRAKQRNASDEDAVFGPASCKLSIAVYNHSNRGSHG
jgi:hypothetical protein